MTMKPEITALVVAMAWMMLPAMPCKHDSMVFTSQGLSHAQIVLGL